MLVVVTYYRRCSTNISIVHAHGTIRTVCSDGPQHAICRMYYFLAPRLVMQVLRIIQYGCVTLLGHTEPSTLDYSQYPQVLKVGISNG